jgi:hypothetical protein
MSGYFATCHSYYGCVEGKSNQMQQKQTVPMERLWGSDKDLETRYGIKRRTWQKYRFLGQGPAFRKCGPKLCLYEFAVVEAWLAAQPLMKSTAERAAA